MTRASFPIAAAIALFLTGIPAAGLAGGNSRTRDAAEPARMPRLAASARRSLRAGDFAAALAARRRLLGLAIRDFGAASRRAAAAMAGLAALYVEMQRYLDAEPLLIAARNDLLARAGPHDPALAPVLCGLARVARARGDPATARKRAEEALALAAPEGGGKPREGTALRALGGALAAQRRFGEGARVLRRALALDRAQDRGGAGRARDLAELGALYVRQQRFAAALPLIERAAFLDQARLGPAHPAIADDYHELGLAYLGLKRPADAVAALRFAIRVLARGAGNGTARLAYAELTLARALHEEGHAGRAKALFAAAQKILGKAEKEERRRERRA